MPRTRSAPLIGNTCLMNPVVMLYIKKNPTTLVLLKKPMLPKQKQHQFLKIDVKRGISTLVFNKLIDVV